MCADGCARFCPGCGGGGAAAAGRSGAASRSSAEKSASAAPAIRARALSSSAPDADELSSAFDRLLDRPPPRQDLQARTAAILLGRARELDEAVACLAALVP
jgi:hypothetical protein